ncbi:MAG: NAD(P)/FAD-dependent oxidoreductase [Williamsia sp.]|nr:NAD(P)/FAD-dependent oxidoreductase [Williamsia sp.]
MKKAIIIGAGPAGLTAAYELLTKTDIVPIVIEADTQVGGLSKTVDYHGNKIDIGGHRFFSKSDKVIAWWLQFLPLQPGFEAEQLHIQYQNKTAVHPFVRTAPANPDEVMLVRKRKSRIYYHRKLFDYPLRLSFHLLQQLGLLKSTRICLSYLYAKLFPLKPEETLEQFFINRFGRELYKTFFKEYTEKVWCVPCNQIPASWGKQRVKNLDITRLIGHAIRSIFVRDTSIDQKDTSTSLIEQFLYPPFGPGQMWEKVAAEIVKKGGQLLLQTAVTGIQGDNGHRIVSVDTMDLRTGVKTNQEADYFFSTMPVKELIDTSRDLPVPDEIKKIAGALQYRDFLIVGILTDDLLLKEKDGTQVSDNWIYIQDSNLKAGRLQLFHNWSPGMIAEPASKWIGVEYFCNETEPFWQLPDKEIAAVAVREMESISVLKSSSVKDTLVVRVKKAYPSYYGAYQDFSRVQDYLNTIENLYPVGRNGMHRYNNSDHSMLTAMAAVENILSGNKDKTNIWEINTEEEYHEEASS